MYVRLQIAVTSIMANRSFVGFGSFSWPARNPLPPSLGWVAIWYSPRWHIDVPFLQLTTTFITKCSAACAYTATKASIDRGYLKYLILVIHSKENLSFFVCLFANSRCLVRWFSVQIARVQRKSSVDANKWSFHFMNDSCTIVLISCLIRRVLLLVN